MVRSGQIGEFPFYCRFHVPFHAYPSCQQSPYVQNTGHVRHDLPAVCPVVSRGGVSYMRPLYIRYR